MKLADHFPYVGNVLFRWRSYLPLVLVPLFLASFLASPRPLGAYAHRAWEVGCLLVALAGLGLRLLTIGTSPRGTSGRNTRAQKATALNTTGPYSVVRHPLYIGNFLIVLGLSCFPRVWFLPIIVTQAALLYYERIAAREEQYLEERFGDEFRRWAAVVPAVIPAVHLYRPPAVRFSWRVALSREFYAIFLVVTVLFLLDVGEDYAVSGRLVLDAFWTTLFVAGMIFFAVMRTLKKHGALARRPEPNTTS